MLARIRGRWLETDFTECLGRAQAIGDESNQHADTSSAETEAPAYLFAQVTGDQRGDERTDVYAHVENREACIATRSAFRIEIADNRRDVRFEQSRAEYDENQADEKGCVGEDDRQRDRQVAQRDENSSVPDSASESEETVSDPAARQRRQVHAGSVDPHDGRSGISLESESTLSQGRRHEQHQQRADSVIRDRKSTR